MSCLHGTDDKGTVAPTCIVVRRKLRFESGRRIELATYLDEHGAEQLIWMGSYGIGPARIVAAAVEQFGDEQGIAWPRAIAPFDVHVVALGKPDTPERAAADTLYGQLGED